MVNQMVDKDLVTALLADLSADDRINLVMIVGEMQTALAVSQIHLEDQVTVDLQEQKYKLRCQSGANFNSVC